MPARTRNSKRGLSLRSGCGASHFASKTRSKGTVTTLLSDQNWAWDAFLFLMKTTPSSPSSKLLFVPSLALEVFVASLRLELFDAFDDVREIDWPTSEQFDDVRERVDVLTSERGLFAAWGLNNFTKISLTTECNCFCCIGVEGEETPTSPVLSFCNNAVDKAWATAGVIDCGGIIESDMFANIIVSATTKHVKKKRQKPTSNVNFWNRHHKNHCSRTGAYSKLFLWKPVKQTSLQLCHVRQYRTCAKVDKELPYMDSPCNCKHLHKSLQASTHRKRERNERKRLIVKRSSVTVPIQIFHSLKFKNVPRVNLKFFKI